MQKEFSSPVLVAAAAEFFIAALSKDELIKFSAFLLALSDQLALAALYIADDISSSGKKSRQND